MKGYLPWSRGAQSGIQGPVSSSKCRSTRHMKAATATQMIGRAKIHAMMTSRSSKGNKAAKRSYRALTCHVRPARGGCPRRSALRAVAASTGGHRGGGGGGGGSGGRRGG